jgi:beta-glucosidase
LRPGAFCVPYSAIKESLEPRSTDWDKDVSGKIPLESVVLVKSEKESLPLNNDSIKSIAVIGPLADSIARDWQGRSKEKAIGSVNPSLNTVH